MLSQRNKGFSPNPRGTFEMAPIVQGGLRAFYRLSAAMLWKRGGHTSAISAALQFSGVRAAERRCALAVGEAVPSTTIAHNRLYWTLARRAGLMAQFQRVKEQFPDHLLLFQVGDFYEIYGQDASA